MTIKGLIPQLPQQGHIKIGGHGEERQGSSGTYRLPEKWDHFKITTNEKDESDNYIVDEDLMKTVTKIGTSDRPKKIGPCCFVFNDIELNFFTSYACWRQSKCLCRGNGENAKRIDEANPEGDLQDFECNYDTCQYGKDNQCKPNGILSVMFPQGGTLGGVYKFRTTSWNSIKSLLGQLQMFYALTNGNIAGVPFCLCLNEKATTVKGKKQTIYFVTLEFEGGIAALQDAAARTSLHMVEAKEAAKEAMLNAAGQLDEPEEFNPQYEVDEETGIITDTAGNIVDAVEDALPVDQSGPEHEPVAAPPVEDKDAYLEIAKLSYDMYQKAYVELKKLGGDPGEPRTIDGLEKKSVSEIQGAVQAIDDRTGWIRAAIKKLKAKNKGKRNGSNVFDNDHPDE